MNFSELRKVVVDAYKLADTDTSIPKHSTQFVFQDTQQQILIRIPALEDALSQPLFGLIFFVVTNALPHLKINHEELRQRLNVALVGKEVHGDELDVRGIVQTTGRDASAIVETRILLNLKKSQTSN